MKTSDNSILYNSEVSAAELNKVSGFNPLKYIRKTDKGAVLDLPYKKLWFRTKYPNGKIRVLLHKMSGRLAAVEARVYFDRRDSEPAANFIVSGEGAEDKLSVERAQNAAIDNALSDAGFGIQFISSDPQSENTVLERPTPKPTVKPKIQIAKTDTAEQPPKQTVIKESAPEVVKNDPETSIAEKEETKPAETAIAENTADPLLSLVDTLESNGLTEGATDDAVGVKEISYTKSTPVDEICSIMTVDEANAYVVEEGACTGWTMQKVFERRPRSAEFYVKNYSGENNILRAAAKIVLAANGIAA